MKKLTIILLLLLIPTALFAGINLIDRIVPKNEAFTGLVEGDQVICEPGMTPPTACFADVWINVDGGTLEIPNSTTLPGGTCNTGEIYMDTNATSGQQLYGCEAGSWVLQGDGGAGGGDDVSVNTVDVTDPDFTDTADISFEVDGSTVTAILNETYLTQLSSVSSTQIDASIDSTEFGRLNGVTATILTALSGVSSTQIDANVSSTEYSRLDGVTSTILTNLSSVSSTQINANISSTEFGYLDGVTSALQTQLDGKQASGTYLTNLSAVSSTQINANVSSTEFGYINDVTSAIQTQLDGKQASGTYLTPLSSVSSTQIDANVSSTEYSRLDGVTANILTNLSSVSSTQINANVSSTEFGYLDGGIDISGESNLAVSTPITLTGDSVGMVNRGTTVTVLHGNAAGNPAFSTVDISSDTNLTAGRSLTLTLDELNADAELYTDGFTYDLENPVTTDNGRFQTEAFNTMTVTRVSCSVDAGSVAINIDERAFATPNTNGTDVLSAVLVCDTNGQSSCASGCDVNTINNAAIDLTDPIALEMTAIVGTPTILRVNVKFTKDD